MWGLRMIITSGSVINIATQNDASNAVETTIGIGLMNSPIIPVERSNGIKAQTVVSVVVSTAVLKSRQTSSPASMGENLLLR